MNIIFPPVKHRQQMRLSRSQFLTWIALAAAVAGSLMVSLQTVLSDDLRSSPHVARIEGDKDIAAAWPHRGVVHSDAEERSLGMEASGK